MSFKQEVMIKKENLSEQPSDESRLLKEKILLIDSDKEIIISTIKTYLQEINIQQDTIEKISSYICDKIYKYRILIIENIFQLINEKNISGPKVEYLCLLNEILKNNFGLKNEEINIANAIKKNFFPYIKKICLDIYFVPDNYYSKAVNYFVGEWDKNQIFDSERIKIIKFEMMMKKNPEIKGTKDDITNLQNLVNCEGYKIEPALIDFSKQVETLKRCNDNFQRRNLLKLENDLIQKQVKLYNSNIQKLKEINLLLNKIDESNIFLLKDISPS